MTRGNLILMIVGALTACALVLAVPAAPLSKPTTIQLQGIATGPPLVTPDADGDRLPAPGDSTFLSLRIVNDVAQFGKPKGATVGQGSVLTWSFAPGIEIGLAAITLPKGTVMASGVGSFTKKFTVAVIGGTGDYSNVTGTVTGTPVNPTQFRIVAKLVPSRT
jgi:hypothetical protein